MSLVRINRNPPFRQLVLFAALWLLFVGGWGVWFGLRDGWNAWSFGFLGAGLIGPALALVSREGIRWLYIGACYAAFPIGWVVSHLLLAIVYYGVMTPIGLIMRIVGYDPMQRTLDRNAKSYWVDREANDDKQRYFRQF